jgi:ABC-type lipoprotein release transport system permease subunit
MSRMLSTVIAAWRNLVKRLSADWLILTAGTVTVLLAMILLAAGPIYADAVTDSALRRTLSSATLADSTIAIEVRTPPDEYDTVDRISTEAITNALSGVDTFVTRVLDAETLELPDQDGDDSVDLAQLRVMEGIAEHSELLQGTWPDGSTSPMEAVVSQSTADLLQLEVGDTLVLVNRRARDRSLELGLVGIYQAEDRSEPFWAEDELASSGVVETQGFRTFGPFIVDESALKAIASRATATWRAHPDYATLEVGETSRIQGQVATLSQTLNDALAVSDESGGLFSEFSVDTGLVRLLSGTGRSLTVTRSSVLALLIQLAILAGYALALTAGLLVETRSTETSLLRARGASPGQVVAVSGFEGILITLPAALAAPWLAAWTLEALVSFGPLAPTGLDVAPTITNESRWIVLLAAAAAVVALVWPVWRSARSHSGSNSRKGRQRARSNMQKAGVDIALVGLAVLAFWQLQTLGPQVSSTIQGRFGVDPILIAAPTLGLLAGSVLALRVVPLLARVAERFAAAGRGSVSALSAWQVARRPLRYARAALLLIMAVAIGFFAAAYSSTWLDSQRDQADFQVGADLRVHPDRRTGIAVDDLHLVSAHESIPGVVRSMPVTRLEGPLPGSDSPGEFVLLDSSAAAEIVVLREDLSPDFAALMGRLHDARPAIAGIAVPGAPLQVGVTIEVVEEELEDTQGRTLEPAFAADMDLVLQDADGLLHRVGLGAVEADGRRQTLEATLVAEGSNAGSMTPAFPIQIVGVEVTSRYPLDLSRTVTFDVVEFRSAEVPERWQPMEFDRSPDSWSEQVAAVGQVTKPPSITEPLGQPDDALRLRMETGVGFTGVATFAIHPPWPATTNYPVVVSSRWLEESNRRFGDEMALDALGTGRSRAEIAGVLDAFPTTDASRGSVVLVDLPTHQMIRYTPGSPITKVGEHWLAISANADEVAETLRSAPLEAWEVVGRTERFFSLTTDPVALGTIGALSIGFLAAAVFAAVGFAVSTTVSARERITEFALLRALGLSPRQLGSWMTLEQGVLVATSLGFGTLVGWLLTTFILPLVSVTQEGTKPFPNVAIVYPWDSVLALEIGLVAVLAVIVAAMTLLLRRLGLGSLLRLGDG